MKEVLEVIAKYLRGMWHRRWIGLATAWIVGIIAVVVAMKVPERYEATARVYVDTETLLRPLLAGLAIQPNIDQQVVLMSRTLISRPNLEKLIRQADLDLNVRDVAGRDALIDTLTKNIGLQAGVRGSNLYTIRYRDTDPERARKVVQSLLNIFVESSLGNKQKDSQTAFTFVDEQIKRYEDALRAAETRLKEFKIKYMGVTGRDGRDYFSRLSAVRDQIEQARMELDSNEKARDAYKLQLSGESQTLIPYNSPVASSSAPDTGVAELDARIGALRKELDDLSRKFTDAHPDVVATRRRLEELGVQRAALVEERKRAAASAPAAAADTRSPVYEQLRLALAQAEANVAASKGKVAAYEAQSDALKKQAKLVPEVEQELVELNRNYDVQKKTYEALLARRDAANMGKEVQDTGVAQFRVIDPPRALSDPVPPTRIMLLGVAFGIALGLGLIASFLTSQIWPTFHAPSALREMVKRPFLGVVSVLPDPSTLRRRRRQAFMFAGGLGILLMTMGGFLSAALLGRIG
jgi:polysaccharide chain length determinant protein (PEP-CTERM system associated)